MPLEDEVERFREKEDEETTLPILPYGSRGVTVTKYDNTTLCCEGIVVEEDNYTAPENVLHSEDVLPAPKTFNFRIQGINLCHQGGNLPVGKENLKMVSNIRVQRMSCLNFFFQLYFMKNIEDVAIPETNIHLNYPMVFGEYFHTIICHVIMS